MTCVHNDREVVVEGVVEIERGRLEVKVALGKHLAEAGIALCQMQEMKK